MPSRLQLYPQCSFLLLALLLLALAAIQAPEAQAQTPFSPDRPGLGTGAAIVPRGHVMIELGLPALEQTQHAAGDALSTSMPTLVRIGLTRQVELRVGGSPYNNLRFDDDRQPDATGLGDVEVGAKIALPVGQPFFVTDVALMPSLTLPVGKAPFGGDRVGASLSALGNWLGWWAIGFGTTSGVALIPVGDEYRLGGQFAISASHAPTPWLSLFVEAAYYPVNDLDDTAYAGAGFTVTPLPNVQLDAYIDSGLNDASTDFLYGAGLAFQL